jgi:hypothetical protein
MPRLSVWMLRVSFLALLSGAALGAWLLGTEPGYDAARVGLRESHLWLLLFGWLVQFVLGVAYWILPRYPTAPERGPPWLAWTVYLLFLLGLGLALLRPWIPGDLIGPSGRLLLASATFAFLLLLWGRAKPFGSS